MGVDLEEDLRRKMIEWNLSAARLAQSPQTGYIHLNYDSYTERDTIPLLENFCYALALLRSRLADNILDAKALLEKLLAFEVDGNYPIYLHDFPQCKDRSFSLDLLPVFHWILADFRPALGEPLACRLEMSIGRILSHGYKMHAQRPLSKSAEFRLKSYFEPHAAPDWTPQSPEEWAEALISLQMAQSRGVSLAAPLLEMALQKWDPQLCAYIGPQNYEKQEPAVTLFDLFMGHYFGRYSRRALEARRVHLLSSLVHSFDDPKAEVSMASFRHAIAPGSSQPYALYWGSAAQLHSLSFDPQKAQCTIARTDTAIEITIELPSRTFQAGEDAIESAFFLNLHPAHQIQVGNAKATTFQLGDKIALATEGAKMCLEFHLEEGEGRFFGHISRANRPNQKGKNLKFEAFDWQIALRTICRSERCVLRVCLSI